MFALFYTYVAQHGRAQILHNLCAIYFSTSLVLMCSSVFYSWTKFVLKAKCCFVFVFKFDHFLSFLNFLSSLRGNTNALNSFLRRINFVLFSFHFRFCFCFSFVLLLIFGKILNTYITNITLHTKMKNVNHAISKC